MHVDTNFIFECSTRYLTCSLCSLMRYRVEHEKKNWYPQAGMKYSHQWRDAVDAVFLLAETEVAMTSVISSLVKDKNYCIFMGYQIFATGKILLFHWCLGNKKILSACLDEPTQIICTV